MNKPFRGHYFFPSLSHIPQKEGGKKPLQGEWKVYEDIQFFRIF